MDYKLYQKSNTLTMKEIKKFIDSFDEEPYYFSCDKDDLISLREYLEQLHEKEEIYREMIKEPLEGIQHKNKWVLEVSPAFALPGISYVLVSKNQPIVRISQKEGLATMISYHSDSNTYLKRKRFVERIKVFENSLDELNEIKDVTNQFDFVREREGILSASNNFIISPIDFNDIEVRTSAYRLLSIHPNEKTIDLHHITRIEFNKNGYTYHRILEKIYLKK